jgi:hypothetical protein
MIKQDKIILFGKDLKVKTGSHIVLLYQDEPELIEVLSEYFSEGINNSNSCVMVCQSDDLKNKIIARIESKNVLPKKEIMEKLVFIKSKEFYFSKNKFNADTIYKKIDEYIAKNSLNGLRAASDTSWINNSNFNDVYQYEKELSPRYHAENILLLCAYPSKEMNTLQIIKTIQSHSLILFKEEGVWKISHAVEKKIFENKIEELEQFTKHAVNRELRMIELKATITKLEKEMEKYKKNSQ